MKLETQLTAKDIFKFSMLYTFSGTSGIFTAFIIIVGIIMCIRGVIQDQGPMYIFTGALIVLLFVVINPLMLYGKAKKQAMTNPAYQQPSYYTLEEDGIHVEIGDQKGTIEWNRVSKMRHRWGMYILYTGRQQAFVFPDEALGAKKDEIVQFIAGHIGTAAKAAPKSKPQGSGISKYAKGAEAKAADSADDTEGEKDDCTE